jgi:hypothetical protein
MYLIIYWQKLKWRLKYGINIVVASSLWLNSFCHKLFVTKTFIPYVFCLSISFWKVYKQGVFSYIFILKTWVYQWVNKKGLTQNKIKIFMYLHLTYVPPYLPT